MTLHVQTGTTNEILRTASKPVSTFTGELKSFALDMIKTMEAENGVGLAAPQVGRNIRMIICKLNPGEDNEVIIPMINPNVVQASADQEEGEEGCLSLPGTWGQVKRSSEIVLRYKNLKGQDQTLVLNHLNARIVQHEIDHLDGILFVDRATEIQTKKKGRKKEAVQI